MVRNAVYPMLRGLAVSLMLAGPAAADTLLIEGVDAASATADERPTRGLSMDSVEARWGAPVSRSAAVGQPPITRWEYPSFVVYFEYRHVIDSVRR
jgi:hypothetical protein